MNKTVLLLVIVSLCSIYAFAENNNKYSDLFIVRFLQCLPYSGQYVSDGITISRKVLRWNNLLCRYSETVTQNNETTTYNCSFSRAQIDELIAAMKSDPNGEGDADMVWEKYKADTNVCTMGN